MHPSPTEFGGRAYTEYGGRSSAEYGGGRREEYRMPWAVARKGEGGNIGVVVEKTGEDNNLSKKQRVMYLYSKTINRAAGRVVCSSDWRDYKLGDWMEFSTTKEENYFGSSRIEAPFPTRLSSIDAVVVQVQVCFFIVPQFISHRKSSLGWKLWSPDIGIMYVDHESARTLGIKEGQMYTGWAQWGTTHLNFDAHNTDPSGWSYEPNVYWQILKDKDQEVCIVKDNARYRRECEILLGLAIAQTKSEAETIEKERRQAEEPLPRQPFEEAAKPEEPVFRMGPAALGQTINGHGRRFGSSVINGEIADQGSTGDKPRSSRPAEKSRHYDHPMFDYSQHKPAPVRTVPIKQPSVENHSPPRRVVFEVEKEEQRVRPSERNHSPPMRLVFEAEKEDQRRVLGFGFNKKRSQPTETTKNSNQNYSKTERGNRSNVTDQLNTTVYEEYDLDKTTMALKENPIKNSFQPEPNVPSTGRVSSTAHLRHKFGFDDDPVPVDVPSEVNKPVVEINRFEPSFYKEDNQLNRLNSTPIVRVPHHVYNGQTDGYYRDNNVVHKFANLSHDEVRTQQGIAPERMYHPQTTQQHPTVLSHNYEPYRSHGNNGERSMPPVSSAMNGLGSSRSQPQFQVPFSLQNQHQNVDRGLLPCEQPHHYVNGKNGQPIAERHVMPKPNGSEFEKKLENEDNSISAPAPMISYGALPRQLVQRAPPSAVHNQQHTLNSANQRTFNGQPVPPQRDEHPAQPANRNDYSMFGQDGGGYAGVEFRRSSRR